MLSNRQASVLNIIVGEYVATAAPVGSASVVRKYGLSVSSATVRNDMAELEGEGYITHPHTSAGRVPADRGYRFIVDGVLSAGLLTEADRAAIERQLPTGDVEIEEWARLAAAVLSRISHNAAFVAMPKSADIHLRQIELVQVHATLAMLILVLKDARVKQQLAPLHSPMEPDGLREVAARLNGLIAGASPIDIDRLTRKAALSPLEQQVLDATKRALRSLQQPGSEDLNVSGVPDAIAQPEFSEGGRSRRFLEIIEQPGALAATIRELLGDEAVAVQIGSENPHHAMREFSLVLARYGVPGEMAGVLGVLGPTRMAYDRVIPSARYLSGRMTELVREFHG